MGKKCNFPPQKATTKPRPPDITSTAGIGRLGQKSARLVHPFLCSIYGAKCDHQKNMPRIWRYVAGKLVPLRPKAIKNELNFGKWTIKMVNNLCQNSYEFMSNFRVEKKVP